MEGDEAIQRNLRNKRRGSHKAPLPQTMEFGNRVFGDSHSIMLLSEIEAIGKALYVDNNPSKTLISSTSGRPNSAKSTPRLGEEGSQKDKRSVWSWKPLKAFSRRRRYKCTFYVHVHSIEGLPPGFNGASFRVHWKRRDGEVVTGAAKVSSGAVEFEDRMVHIGHIHGSRGGSNNAAKYESIHCSLYAKMVTLPDLDLGKQRVDLARLLPLTFEELEGEKSSGKWETSYKMSGKAAGSVMNVSFGYSLIGDKVGSPNKSIPESLKNPRQNDKSVTIRRSESLPNVLVRESATTSQSVETVKDLHIVNPPPPPHPQSDLASSVITLYKKLDEDRPSSPKTSTFVDDHVDPGKPDTRTPMDSSIGNECEDSFEFSVIERGIELSSPPNARRKPEEFPTDDNDVSTPKPAEVENESTTREACTKESIMKELESALKNVTNLEEDLDSLVEDEDDDEDNDTELDNGFNKNEKSRSYNDVTEAEFLKMLGIEDSPVSSSSETETASPTRRKHARASANSIFVVETDDEELGVCVQDASSGCSSEVLTDAFEFPKTTLPEGNKKPGAKALEDLETEALMCEYRFNENAFHYSPRKSSGRYGTTVDQTLPPLGAFLRTKDGGFVRSMNPSLFRNAKSPGGLIMQVSAPVVVPAEMGSGVIEILQRLASAGVEKLSMQATTLMPLEDMTGKTMQEVASTPSLERKSLSGLERNKHNSSSPSNETGSEYISLEDLAPLAMYKMEALSIEGLRIQSGVSGDEEPSSVKPKAPFRQVASFHGKGSSIRNTNGSVGLGAAIGLQLLDVKGGDEADADDGLMNLSLSLDEWMKLDSGDPGAEDARTTKILAAHHAARPSRGKAHAGSGTTRRSRFGDNFTVALMVQLRDPQRNLEPVGAPMLSLVRVQRSLSPPARGPWEGEEEATARFKIDQVHVVGVTSTSTSNTGKKVWGSSSEQQSSGSRWLRAHGMGKTSKSPFLKSSTMKAQSGESLWSVSSRVHGAGAKWKDLAALNPHVRNPNVVFPSETIRFS